MRSLGIVGLVQGMTQYLERNLAGVVLAQIPQVALLEIRKQMKEDAAVLGAVLAIHHGGLFVRIMGIVGGDAELFEIVLGLGARRRLADFLHRGHQERDQHRNDRDDHQKLDQRETAYLPSGHR